MSHKCDSQLFLQKILPFILVVTVFIVYGQVATHNFIIYDDPGYVQDNKIVLAGLSLSNILWAFTTFTFANWHPITWLSYMLDIHLFGPHPGIMLLENVVLHAINSLLLFQLLRHLCGSFWRSLVVAALFALHPLHVESVAWISERKDVLSTLFCLLTLYFHVRYSEQCKIRFYILALSSFTLGLLTKPMLVTIPVIMLLIDYWPLKRFAVFDRGAQLEQLKSLHLFIEKLPFLALAVASSVVTVIAQTGAISPLNTSPLSGRIANGLNTYLIYLKKMVWPFDLAPFYPFPAHIAPWPPIGSALVLITITVTAFILRKRAGYLLVGWLWYLITLLPVIGIIRVGGQAMADRYTYIPLIGIFIVLVWGCSDVWQKKFIHKTPLFAMTTLVLLVCSIITWRQVALWKKSDTLFSHAAKVTQNNYIASSILAIDRMKNGGNEEALRLFDQSIKQAPWFVDSYIKKAHLLKKMGRNEEAIDTLKQTISIIIPNKPDISADLVVLLISQNRIQEAVEHLQNAPQGDSARYNLKIAVEQMRSDPQSAAAYYNLALTLCNLGKLEDAVIFYNRSLELDSEVYETHNNLGITLAEIGKYDEAISHFREVMRLKPDYKDAEINLKRVLKMKSVYRTVRSI